MGRFKKSVVIEEGINRRELGYYSTPEFVARFMSETMIQIKPDGKYIFDPCVGKEELISVIEDNGFLIDGMDVFNHGNHQHCNFIQGDFIEFYYERKKQQLLREPLNLKYDYYIANPPYNCHEVDYIKDNKTHLSKLFSEVGVHNMYSMFTSAIIDCAKEGAVIAIITADSFLTAKMHKGLRKQILDTCSIHYLALCPTDLFWNQKADVRTSILILQKGTSYQGNVKVLNRPSSKSELANKLRDREFNEVTLDQIVDNIHDNKGDIEFLIDIPSEIRNLFVLPRLGEVYRCITGISTGNDAVYLRKNREVGFDVPFYKNPGSKKFFCEPDGYLTNNYLEYDKLVKNFMVRNKTILLEESIICSSMGLPFSACYKPKGATFGVNANIVCPPNDIWWLMAYLNSRLVTYIVRGALNRSNMVTSGYVSKIPLMNFSKEEKESLSYLAKQAYEIRSDRRNKDDIQDSIDKMVFKSASLSKRTEDDIVNFSKNLQQRV